MLQGFEQVMKEGIVSNEDLKGLGHGTESCSSSPL